MRTTLVAIALLLVTGPATATMEPQESKTRLPDKSTRDMLTSQLKDLFKAEYSKRDVDSRVAFARKLITDAASVGDADQRFVMLVEARDLAAHAGDFRTATDAINGIVDRYDVKAAGVDWTSLAQKSAALAMARKMAKTREAAAEIARGYIIVAQEGLEAGDYDAAGNAAKQAGSVARTARDLDLSNEAKALAKEITSIEKEFKGVQSAELKLSVTPDDADANLVAGRFYCFVKGDWENGIPCLAKGKDAGLKAVAEKELAKPKDAASRAALGDAWVALSKKERGRVAKVRYQERARQWYQRALAIADGFVKLGIEKKLKALPKPPPSRAVDLLRLVKPASHAVNGTWRFERGLLISPTTSFGRLFVPYIPPEEYDIRIVAKRRVGDSDLYLGLIGGGKQFALTIDAEHGNDTAVGGGGTKVSGPFLPPGKSVTLVVSVRAKTLALTINGKKVLMHTLTGGEGLFFADGWTIPDKRVLFLGAHDSEFEIGRVMLTPVSGVGQILR